MKKLNLFSAKYIAKGGIIAALYVVLTYISYTMNLSGQLAVQLRLSEALTILPFFTSAAIPGLTIGCLLANLLTGSVVWDVIFGTLATLLGAIGTFLLRKYRFAAPIPPIISNTLIIPFVLTYAYQLPDGIPLLMLSVFLGEAICCGVLGILLQTVIIHTHGIRKIIEE
jgi:uncharacterized membrane protein